MADEEEYSTTLRPADVELTRLYNRLWKDWGPHRETNVTSVREDLRKHYKVVSDDQEVLNDLLIALGQVIMGQGPAIARLRRAHAELIGANDKTQARHVAALNHCQWALWAYRSARSEILDGKKQAKADYQAHLESESLRRSDRERARMLKDSLAELEPAFAGLDLPRVNEHVRFVGDSRSNGSPVTLLERLIEDTLPAEGDDHEAAFGGANTEALKGSLKRAKASKKTTKEKKRQLGT